MGPAWQARLISTGFNSGIPQNYSPTSFLINTLLPANNAYRTMDYVATIDAIDEVNPLGSTAALGAQ